MDTDGGYIVALRSSAVAAGGVNSGRFCWVTVRPGPMSAAGTVHLTRKKAERLAAALLEVSR